MATIYEQLRKKYVKKFKKEAPHVAPWDESWQSGLIRRAIKSGNELPEPPEGYVT